MNFCWVTINVQDIEKSTAFYNEIVGLTVKRKMNPMPGVEIAFLASEEDKTEIELIMNKKQGSTSFAGLSFGFYVKSLDETIKRLNMKGVTEIERPFQPIPAMKFIFIKDPDGAKVQFIEKL